jgi:hypothetical protein
MKHFAKTGFLTFVWISLIALACNLGASEPPPPTLAPRIDTQPVATLGVYTPLPGQPDATPTPGIPATPIATKLYTMLSQIDQTRLLFHIDSLEHFHTRHVNSVGKTDGTGITAAFNYINDEFNRIQGLPDSHFVNLGGQPFAMTYNGMTTQQHNAVGVINGTEAGRGVVIVGAHYDSRTDDLTDATSSGPGADDNGSGVAAILELARVMSQYPSRASIIFVLFAGEEEGRYGSKAFVNDYVLANNIPVSVMINLDTIGNVQNARGDVNDTQIRLFADPKHEPSLWMAQMITFIADNNSTDLKVMMQNTIDREGRFGDHQSFRDVDIPAVRIIEANEESNHREGLDKVEYVEPYYLERSTRTILSILVALTDGPPPPDYRNIVIRDNGDGTRRLVWDAVPDAVGYVVALRFPDQTVFGQVFNAPGLATAYNCDCFASSRYQSLAIAAVSADGIMGPLSHEYRVP